MRLRLRCVMGLGLALAGCSFGAPANGTAGDDTDGSDGDDPIGDGGLDPDAPPNPLDANLDTAPGLDAMPGPDAQPVCAGLPDHDGDGLRDDCDKCPHITNPAVVQPDMDNDGVGDACDPHPAQPIDKIVLFDDFNGPALANWVQATADSGDIAYDTWTVAGGYAVAGDKTRFGALVGTLAADRPTVTTEVVIADLTEPFVYMGNDFDPFVAVSGAVEMTRSVGCLVAKIQNRTTQNQAFSVYAGHPQDPVAITSDSFQGGARFRMKSNIDTNLTCKFGATESAQLSVSFATGAPKTGYGLGKFLVNAKFDYVFVVGHRP